MSEATTLCLNCRGTFTDDWADKCGRDDEKFRSPIPGIMREAKRQAQMMPALSLMAEIQDAVNSVPGLTRAELHSADGITEITPEKKH